MNVRHVYIHRSTPKLRVERGESSRGSLLPPLSSASGQGTGTVLPSLKIAGRGTRLMLSEFGGCTWTHAHDYRKDDLFPAKHLADLVGPMGPALERCERMRVAAVIATSFLEW